MLCDSHVHSLFSFDGHDSAEALCKGAVQAGVTALAVTDHDDIDGVLDGLYPPYFPDQAREAVLAAREQYSGQLEVAFGVELGQPHLRPAEAAELLRRYDYDFVLASVHNLENVPDFSFLNYAEMPQFLIDSLFRRNLAELGRVAAFPGVNALAHVTYPCRYARAYRREIGLDAFTEEFRALFRIMNEHGVALELNTKMLRCGEAPDPTPEILHLFRDCGGELVTVGSDAHVAADIGKGVGEAYGMLREVGFRYVSYAAPGGLRQMKL